MSPGPFGDVAALEQVAVGLEQAHVELEQAGHALEEVDGELTAPAGPWAGAASEAFQTQAADRRTRLHHVAAAVAATGQAVQRLASRLEVAHQEALAARTRAEAGGVLVDDVDYRVTPVLAAAPAEPALAAAMQRATAELDAAHQLAVRAWSDAAAELALVQLTHDGHGASHTVGVTLGLLHKLRGVLGTPASVAETLGGRAERAWDAFDAAVAARHLTNPPLQGTARRAARAAVRITRDQARAATATAERATQFAERVDGTVGPRAQVLKVVAAEAGELSEGVARVPGLRRLPVVGVALAGAATVAESEEVGWGRSIVANGGALAAGEAAAVGITAAAAVVGAPVAVTVAAAVVVGYGLGTAVHSLALHGDLREFGDEAHMVADGVTKAWKAVTPW